MTIPTTSAEPLDKSRVAAERFARAKQVAGCGDFDYAIQLLLDCCKLEPANLVYRNMLRRTQKSKFDNRLQGSRLAPLQNIMPKARLKSALRSRDFLKALELGEEILVRDPWDLHTQMHMAEAADALGMLDTAIWLLEQARHRDGRDTNLTRALARLYEKRGNFAAAIALWDQVRKALPLDAEAKNKSKSLAASETISRGRYGQETPTTEESAPSIGDTRDPQSFDGTPLAPTHERLDREAAPLLAKIAAAPADPVAYLELSVVYARDGRSEEAREILVKGMNATGENIQIRIALMECDLVAARNELVEIDENLRERPESEDLEETEPARERQRLAADIAAGEIELYRLKVERWPHDFGHRIELGVRLLQAGQVDAAILELQAGRKDPRQQWRALMNLGLCFKARQNWHLARRNFVEALDQMPASEEASRKEVLFQVASGYAAAGDFNAAIETGNDLANRDFTYRDIGQLLDQWQKQLENE